MSTAESAPAGADSSSSSSPAPDAPSQPQHESHSSQGNQSPPLSRKDKRKRQQQQQQQPKEQRQPKQQQQQQRAPRPEFPPIEVEYVVKDGLRHVVPYVYAFAARAKGRWWGRPVLEVFQTEFRTYNPTYYEASVRAGTITVNGQQVEPGYLLKNNDLLLHKCHRHEPPVSGEQPLPIVAEDERAVVVSKPATIPVHPCGAYRFNSVLHILQKERPDLFPPAADGNGSAHGEGHGSSKAGPGLHVIYRLDRLTSGLLILAKSPEEAARMCAELQSGRTKKYYLALVKGDFASRLAFPAACRWGTGKGEGEGGEGEAGGEVLFDDWCGDVGEAEGEEEGGNGNRPAKKKKDAAEDAAAAAAAAAATAPAPMHWRVQSDGTVDVQAGIRCVSYRDGVYECSPQGKPSRTLFRSLGFDGENSLVACRPITGRTHQIRNHLQWLGFPIANDPNYGDAATVAAFKGQWGKQTEAYEDLATTYAPDLPSADDGGDDDAAAAPLSEDERIRRLCPYCQHGDAVMFKGEQLHHKGIYLHAWRYEGMPREGDGGKAGWAYETPYPEWAQGFEKGGTV